MSNTFTTPLISTLTFPVLPQDRAAAAKLWRNLFYQASRYETSVNLNFKLANAIHYNPEYFLSDWTHTILDKDAFLQDVLGWALKALKIEQEHVIGQMPYDADMLKQSQCLDFLTRFKSWAEARRAYHSAALRLTFYNDDPLASKEPLASDAERLKARLADWRDVKLREQKRLFENDRKLKPALRSLKDDEQFTKQEKRDVMFRHWLEDNGLKTGAIACEAIEWLCWMHLVSPIRKEWQLHDIGLAILKRFPGAAYVKKAKAWWKNPPDSLNYDPIQETDGSVERFINQVYPVEFKQWQVDWLSNERIEMYRSADKLRKQLPKAGVAYKKRPRGCPKSKTEFESNFDNTSSPEDPQQDAPRGWLLAKRLTA